MSQDQARQTVSSARKPVGETRSILIVVDRDAPLLPDQTERRASLGLARLGATSDNGSVFMLPNGSVGPIFEVQEVATQETIVNARLSATGVAGVDCQEVTALPGTIAWHSNRRRGSHPTR